MKELIIYTDGGSRGNPGPAALGVAILDIDGKVITSFGEYLSIQTNNFAEYTALIRALEESKKLGATKVQIRMDSELIVKQMTGIYKIKHPNIQPLAQKVRELLQGFEGYSFQHVRREFNKLADSEVNKCLDNAPKSLYN